MIIKKLLTITDTFNDVFTDYQDKISSVTMVVDTDHCECLPSKKCGNCKLIERVVLTEITEL